MTNHQGSSLGRLPAVRNGSIIASAYQLLGYAVLRIEHEVTEETESSISAIFIRSLVISRQINVRKFSYLLTALAVAVVNVIAYFGLIFSSFSDRAEPSLSRDFHQWTGPACELVMKPHMFLYDYWPFNIDTTWPISALLVVLCEALLVGLVVRWFTSSTRDGIKKVK